MALGEALADAFSLGRRIGRGIHEYSGWGALKKRTEASALMLRTRSRPASLPALVAMLHKRRKADGSKPPAPARKSCVTDTRAVLLQLRLAAGLDDLLQQRLGVGLGDALLDRLRRAVDQVLRLLEAEAGYGTDDLDDVHLVVAGSGEHDRELGLLLRGGRGGAATARCCNRHRGRGGGDPELVLHFLDELREFEDGHVRDRVQNVSACYSHFLCAPE